MDSLMWAGVLSFLVIMAFWSINFIAIELEMPFGDDLNDLPLLDLQRDYNLSIISLMDKRATVHRISSTSQRCISLCTGSRWICHSCFATKFMTCSPPSETEFSLLIDSDFAA